MNWQARIDAALAERRAAWTFRQRQPLIGGSSRWIRWEGKNYLNFAGNDYLGMSQHPAIIKAWEEGARQYGAGSGGSGHVTGFTPAQEALELRLARWLNYPRALLFSSGFAANQALISALMHKGDQIVADKLSHASLQEAANLSPAELRRFFHNNMDALARRLRQPCSGLRLVATEGVFSMDGDCAPLAEIADITASVNGWLLVDDAHGIGVTGPSGRGSCAAAGIQPELLVVTFGKAFGVGGAAVLCSETVADYLLQFARHLIYSTALPPAHIAAIGAALSAVQQADDARARLAAHVTRLRAGMAGLPLELTNSQTAIQPLIVGDNQQAFTLAQRLRQGGIWAVAMRPPTVPAGSARLRITLSAAHQNEDIDQLLKALYVACK